MSKIKLDNGLEYDAAPEVVAHIEAMRRDASEAKSKTDAAQAKADALQAQVDGHKAALDAARKDGEAAARARVQLDAIASEFKVDAAGKTDRQVKEAVIVAVRGEGIDLSDKSDAYVDAAFDIARDMKDAAAMAKQRIDAKGGNPAGATGEAYVPASQRHASYMDNLGKKEGA